MTCIGFVGLGLIGGSLARSIRKFHPDYRLVAYSRTRAAVEEAVRDEIIDQILEQYDPAFGDCDMIFLCTPVQTNITYLPFMKKVMKKGCILTDVGSVKGEMSEAAAAAGLSASFIGGHPMAGTEKTGYANSTDYLLENAYYFITPSADSDPAATEFYKELVSSIRAIPLVLSAKEHDYVVAGISHLPHMAAFSLVNTVKSIDTPEEYMKLAAAGGFRDITRVASSSPVMWQQICLSNQGMLSEVLEKYITDLQHIKELVDAGAAEELGRLFADSKEYRDSIDDHKRGSVGRIYVLHVDIYDEAGGIATITTLLAMNQINIKNIGIIHNREFEDGVLRIEFYDAASRDLSEEVLTRRNYKVRKRT